MNIEGQRSNAWSSGRILLISSAVGVMIYVMLDAIAQSLPPHYSLGQAESLLAIGPYGYVMTLNFIVRGLTSLAFIFGFLWTVDLSKDPKYRPGLALLGVWAIMAFVLAAFPADISSSMVTFHGRIHDLAAFIAFICGGFGVLLISLEMNDGASSNVRKIALPLGFLSALLSILTFLVIPLFPKFSDEYWGIIERIFIGSVLLWILVISLYFTMRITGPLKKLERNTRP